MTAKIGSLRADVTLETGRFKAGAGDIQALNAKMRNDFKAMGRDIRKAANDMGLSMGGFTSQVAALKAQVNPLAAAQANYRRETELLSKALKLGAISGREYGEGMRQAALKMAQFHKGVQVTGAGVTKSTGSMQAGMQQLGYQINDVATMWSLGAKPMQIFSSQIGQTTQAIALMSNGAGKFGAFMASGWGVAITAGVIVLGSFIPKLLETKDAMEDAEKAADSLSEVQGMLGEAFDLSTGKIRNETNALKENTAAAIYNLQLKSLQLKTQAREQREAFSSGLQQASSPSVKRQVLMGLAGNVDLQADMYKDARSSAVSEILRSVERTDLAKNPAVSKDAWDKLGKLDYSKLGITLDDARKALGAIISAKDLENTASEIDSSLKSGELQGALRDSIKPEKPKKTRAPSMATDAQQDAELASLNREYLQAKLDVTTDAEERANLEAELLSMERSERLKEIEANKRLTDAQKNARKKIIEKIYGRETKDGEIPVGTDPAHIRMNREQAARETAMANDMLSRQAQTLQAWADIEPDTKKRAELDRKALDLQQQIQRNLLEQQIANGDIADADKARAELASQEAAARRRLMLQSMSPGQRYAYDVRQSVSDMNSALESVRVGGLESLEDGLTGIITRSKSVSAAIRDMSNQIVGDLARLAIRKAIIAPIAERLFPANDNGGESATKLVAAGGTLTAAGSVLTASATAWAATAAQIQAAAAALGASGGTGGGASSGSDLGSIGSILSGATTIISKIPGFAGGTKFAPGGLAIVGEKGPELVDLPMGSQVIPNHELSAMAGGGGTTNNYYTMPSDEFWGQVDSLATGRANSVTSTAITRERQHGIRKSQRKLGRRAA